MLVDIHIRNADGSPGRLFDTVLREPIERKTGLWIVFDREMYKVLTGVRAMIVVPEYRVQHLKGIDRGLGK